MLMNSAIYCIAGMYLHVLIQMFKVQHLAIRDKYLINCIGVGPKCLDTGKFSRGQYWVQTDFTSTRSYPPSCTTSAGKSREKKTVRLSKLLIDD